MDGPQLFLHPPSPPTQPSPARQSPEMDEPFVLPPVSTLLRETPSPPTDISYNSNILPSLHLPDKRSPSPQIRDAEPVREPVEMFPPLTLTIPCQSISSCSPCTSPASSPFPYQGHLDTPQTSPSSSPHPGHDSQANHHHLLLPPPCNGRRTRSPSNASTSSFSSVSTFPSLPSSPALQRRLSDPPLYSAFDHDPSTSWQRPQSTSPSPSLSPASTAPLQFKSPHTSSNNSSTAPPTAPVVAKRKRGRPPNALRQVSSRDNWTFVTPTVWDVKRGQITNVDQQQQEDNNTAPVTVVVWPESCNSNNNEQVREGLNTFTSTRMDSTLSMPKKKRGRKPKMQLEGNSCFVWRDLTARRSTNRSHHKRKVQQPPSSANRPQQQPSSSAITNAPTARSSNDNLASRVESLTLADKNNSL